MGAVTLLKDTKLRTKLTSAFNSLKSISTENTYINMNISTVDKIIRLVGFDCVENLIKFKINFDLDEIKIEEIELVKELDFGVVSADTLIALWGKLSESEDISFIAEDEYIEVKEGNNIYKLIKQSDTTGNKLEEVKTIVPEGSSVLYNTELSGTYLTNLIKYNSIEIAKGIFYSPVQRLFYITPEYCITFTSGACITYNNDKLTEENDLKLLLSSEDIKALKIVIDSVKTTEELRPRFIVDKFTSSSFGITTYFLKVYCGNITLERKVLSPEDSDIIAAFPVGTIAELVNNAKVSFSLKDGAELSAMLDKALIFKNNFISGPQPVKLFVDSTTLTVTDSLSATDQSAEVVNTVGIDENLLITYDINELYTVLGNINVSEYKISDNDTMVCSMFNKEQEKIVDFIIPALVDM